MAYSLKKMREMASECGACIEKNDDGYEVYFFNDHVSHTFDNLGEVRGFLLEDRASVKIVNGVYEEEECTGLEGLDLEFWL